MQPRIAILADDLTGALDAAAPFAAAPGGVAVATRPDAFGAALASGAGVVAVSTRSREIDAAEAARRVAALVAALPPGVRLVKKIDSRLKGNVAAEVGSLGARALVVLPAIPDFGRVVRDGTLSGFGVERPLPVRAAFGALEARIPDVATEADMLREVGAAPEGAVLVGARGMARALASVMGFGPVPDLPPLAAPLCIAVGSIDPITLAQVAALREAAPGVVHVAGPSGALPPPTDAAAAVTLVQATRGKETRPDRVAVAFARSAAPYLAAMRSMVLTGGATAEAILDVLGIDLLQVEGEALPGIPCCRAGEQAIVTKSGGFGEPDALVRLAAAVRRP